MNLALLIHIISAILTLGSCTYVWINPSFSLQKILRLFTGISLTSGAWLMTNPLYLTRPFCLKLGIYISIIIVAEFVLHKKILTANSNK